MSRLPPGWTAAALDRACVVTEQVTPEPDRKFQYIDISSVDRFTKRIVNSQETLGSQAPSRARKLVRSGDTLVSMTRPNLNAVALVDSYLDGQIASTGFEVLRAPGMDARWLGYLVRSEVFVNAMCDLVQGALYPAVRSKDVRGFVAPFAPAAEQQRIANKLDSVLARVDACRDRLARVAPLLKRFRQSVLAVATSGWLTTELRESGVFSAWSKTDVQSVCRVGTGSTPLRSSPGFFSSSGMPWITSGATSQQVVMTAEEFVTPVAITAHRLKIYPTGTVLVAMYGEGKTRGQVSELGVPATINQACAAIVADLTQVLPRFIKLVLHSNYFEMRQLAEGGNQPNLNLSKIKRFPLGLPCLEEQAEIVRRVESLFAYADRLEARLATARTAVDRLTPALLAKAFRGELVPQDPNDEPAAEMLRRLSESRQVAPAKPRRSRGA